MNIKPLCICCFLLAAPFVRSQTPYWSLNFVSGAASNFSTPLVIKQDGYPDIRIKARYESRSLEFPIYYEYRLERWKDSSAWEAGLTHHKIYLENTTPEVESFSVSHGYNLIAIHRVWQKPWLTVRIGGGVVLAHAESDIRGQHFEEDKGLFNKGFYLAGPTLSAGAGHRFYFSKKNRHFWKNFYFNMEGRLTFSWARLPVVNGKADVPNVAVHYQFGFGYDFHLKKQED